MTTNPPKNIDNVIMYYKKRNPNDEQGYLSKLLEFNKKVKSGEIMVFQHLPPEIQHKVVLRDIIGDLYRLSCEPYDPKMDYNNTNIDYNLNKIRLSAQLWKYYEPDTGYIADKIPTFENI